MGKKLRLSCRGLIYHDGRVLLQNVKERDFWNVPGGGFEETDESFVNCVVREIQEETGMETEFVKLIYVQEFHVGENVEIGLFFLLKPKDVSQYNEFHIDQDAPNNKNRLKWFSVDDLQNIDVKPHQIKENLEDLINGPVNIFDQELNRS